MSNGNNSPYEPISSTSPHQYPMILAAPELAEPPRLNAHTLSSSQKNKKEEERQRENEEKHKSYMIENNRRRKDKEKKLREME
jgi:hypothetical protein